MAGANFVMSSEAEYKAAMTILWDALQMYADPSFYHAITIIGDSPTGGFDKDVSMVDKAWHYVRPMPGKIARDAIEEVCKKYGHLTLDPNCEEEEKENDD